MFVKDITDAQHLHSCVSPVNSLEHTTYLLSADFVNTSHHLQRTWQDFIAAQLLPDNNRQASFSWMQTELPQITAMSIPHYVLLLR